MIIESLLLALLVINGQHEHAVHGMPVIKTMYDMVMPSIEMLEMCVPRISEPSHGVLSTMPQIDTCADIAMICDTPSYRKKIAQNKNYRSFLAIMQLFVRIAKDGSLVSQIREEALVGMGENRRSVLISLAKDAEAFLKSMAIDVIPAEKRHMYREEKNYSYFVTQCAQHKKKYKGLHNKQGGGLHQPRRRGNAH